MMEFDILPGGCKIESQSLKAEQDSDNNEWQ